MKKVIEEGAASKSQLDTIIRENKESDIQMSKKMDNLLVAITDAVAKSCNELYKKVTKETDEKLSASEAKILNIVASKYMPKSVDNSSSQKSNGNNVTRLNTLQQH